MTGINSAGSKIPRVWWMLDKIGFCGYKKESNLNIEKFSEKNLYLSTMNGAKSEFYFKKSEPLIDSSQDAS